MILALLLFFLLLCSLRLRQEIVHDTPFGVQAMSLVMPLSSVACFLLSFCRSVDRIHTTRGLGGFMTFNEMEREAMATRGLSQRLGATAFRERIIHAQRLRISYWPRHSVELDGWSTPDHDAILDDVLISIKDVLSSPSCALRFANLLAKATQFRFVSAKHVVARQTKFSMPVDRR